MKPELFDPSKNYNDKQKSLTELNSDGNSERGRNGEDLSKEEHPNCGTPECCGQCDTASTGNDG